jgi:hypothetical protein
LARSGIPSFACVHAFTFSIAQRRIGSSDSRLSSQASMISRFTHSLAMLWAESTTRKRSCSLIASAI